jgi:BirA family biotin operon repressor/biotin-[acetyl-CoA-carboxylase] ligase
VKGFFAVPAPANVVWLDEVDSTNDMVARVLASWPADDDRVLADTLVVAGRQSAGKGRGNHVWESPLGGLYASWMAWLETSKLAWLPMAAGVSLLQAVEELLPPGRAGLKWPNDLVADGRKLGGVLCQSRGGGEWCWVIVGFGINIDVEPAAIGNGAPATSLRAHGLTATTPEAIWWIAESFLTNIRSALDDPAQTRAVWAQRCVHRPGEVLRVRSGSEVVFGKFSGFGENGQLELEVDGKVRSFAAAELVMPLSESGG